MRQVDASHHDRKQLNYIIMMNSIFYKAWFIRYRFLYLFFLMIHHNIYLVLLTTLSTWMFAQSIGEQLNEAGQVQGALSSAMVDPSSLYNLQVPVVPPTSQVSQPSVPTITGITNTGTTSNETILPTSTFMHTSATSSATHTATPPPTSDANMLKSISTVFSIIGIPIFLFIYANV